MSKETFIRVIDFVDGTICVSTKHAQKLYNKVAPMVRERRKITLSFDRVKHLIPVFFYASIGRLFEEFSEERISKSISFRDVPPEWGDLLRHLMDRAKDYYENRETYDRAWREVMGEEDCHET